MHSGNIFRRQEAANGRDSHIAELLEHMPTCVPEGSGNAVFSMPIQLPDGSSGRLRIALPSSFPRDPPHISLPSGNPQGHSLVGPSGDLPPRMNWSPSRDRLWRCVDDAFTMLTGRSYSQSPQPTRSPYAYQPQGAQQPSQPSVVASPYTYVPVGGRPGGAPNLTPLGNVQSSPVSDGGATVVTPTASPIPDSFPELEELTAEQLVELASDDAKFTTLAAKVLQDTAPVLRLKAKQAEVESLARANMDRQQQLQQIQTQCAIVRSSELPEVQATFQERMKQYQELLPKLEAMDGAALIAGLRAAADAINAESEKLQDGFKDGTVPLADYLQKHTALRALYHERELKCTAAQQGLRPTPR